MSRTKPLLIGLVVTTASALLIGPPPAAHATGTAQVGVTTASIPVPVKTFALVAAGPDSMWVADIDEDSYATIARVDPTDNTLRSVSTLDIAAGGFAVGFGSLWASGWNANIVERIDPATMRVQARIRVGLGPEFLHAAFGSVWVGNHHDHSVMRIDPATNRVVNRYPVGTPNAFRSGPQTLTDDGRDIYVGSSNDQQLFQIDPRTNSVSEAIQTPTAFCGGLVALGHQLWAVSHCENGLFAVNPITRAVRSYDYSPGLINDETSLHGVLWVAYDKAVDPNTGLGTRGSVDARNGTSGAVIGTITVGGDTASIGAGFGALWTLDPERGILSRIGTSL